MTSGNKMKENQIIFYGAPGTGKSYKIKRDTKDEAVIRTTFHPDSDYSTFVGAYKPTMGSGTVYGAQGPLQKNGKDIEEPKIKYEFVMQAFLKAYLAAWKKLSEKSENPKPQFLVIEEINRGNCAQIFGDIFQLLDRSDNKFSSYPIEADTDLKQAIKKAFEEDGIYKLEKPLNVDYAVEEYTSNYGLTLSEDIMEGNVLLLPKNLYIWATMNTSDQSLFPIDSAFKRRWDWQYMPIAYDCKNWEISVGGFIYSWGAFLKEINARIGTTTNSEDKKLGYFFCNAKDNIIDARTFVGKVIFYLWNDVFKDYDLEGPMFVDTDNTKLTFDKFYTPDASGNATVVEEKVINFLDRLGLEKAIGISDVDDTGSFNITYNGEAINGLKPSDAFVTVIQKIGLERLLDKKIDGAVIVTHQKPASQCRQIGDYFINTGLWPKYKKRWLEVMAKEENINLTVE